MAWGAARSAGVSDWVERLQSNDPRLTSIYVLRTRKWGDEEVTQLCAALRQNTALKDLYASGRAVTPESLRAVADMLKTNRTLQSLCIGDTDLGDEGLTILSAGLQHNAGLIKLDLENKGVGAAGLGALAHALQHNTSLETLVLSRNSLTRQGLAVLGPGVGNLRTLQLQDCSLDGAAIESWVTTLPPGGSKLHEVNLGDNPLGAEGGEALAKLLGSATQLRSLCLSSTGIGSPGLVALAGALSTNASLETLDVSSCNVGDDGITALASALSHARFLNSLKIGNNGGITSQGIVALAKSMAEHGQVSELDVTGVKLAADAVQALAACSGLRRLCLFNTCLGASHLEDSSASGIAALTEAVATASGFQKLQQLDIGGCGLTAEEMSTLFDSLDRAECLQLLVIGANPGTEDEGFEAVVSTAQEKQGASFKIVWQTSAGDAP